MGHTYPWGCMGGRLSSDAQRVAVVVVATGSVANSTAAIERP